MFKISNGEISRFSYTEIKSNIFKVFLRENIVESENISKYDEYSTIIGKNLNNTIEDEIETNWDIYINKAKQEEKIRNACGVYGNNNRACADRNRHFVPEHERR